MKEIVRLLVGIGILLIGFSIMTRSLRQIPGVGFVMNELSKLAKCVLRLVWRICSWLVHFAALCLKQLGAQLILTLGRIAPPRHGWHRACDRLGRSIQGNGRWLPR